MPSSTVLTPADPDELRSSLRAFEAKIDIVGAGEFSSELARMELHRLWLQRCVTSLPMIVHGENSTTRLPVFFLAHPEHSPIAVGGMQVRAGEIVVEAPDFASHVRAPAAFAWGSMSLAPEDLAAYGRALAGRELAAPATTRILRPSPAAMARLVHLHRAASNLATTVPDIFAHPEVARAMEQELVRAMIACMTEGEAVGAVRRGQRPVMKLFEQALEAHTGETVYLTELCAEIGVSDRNLRQHCWEHLGMSPQRFLWLRRMNMARRALARSHTGQSTVTAIATEHGFGELGRFSVQYRRLFGESPSETLRHVPDEPRPLRLDGWPGVAAAGALL